MTKREQLMQAQMSMLFAWDAWADMVEELCKAAEDEVRFLDNQGGAEATARNLEHTIEAVRRCKP